MKAFALRFAPGAEFVNVVGPWWKGRGEIEKAHASMHATMFRQSRLTMADLSIRFPLGSVAIARSRWILEGHVSPEDAPLPARKGILLDVLRRGPAAWSIVDSPNTDTIDGQRSCPSVNCRRWSLAASGHTPRRRSSPRADQSSGTARRVKAVWPLA
jgi:uncharacterized protein (TIGR02246 family)